MQLETGAVLEGRVTGITAFGAFVALPDGKSGLVHISEVANTYVNDIHEHLSVGQTLKVKVLSISPEGKISLSAKRAVEAPPPAAAPRPAQPRRPAESTAPAADGAQVYVPTKSGDQNFEDKLKHFMQESDSKISGNRLYDQPKRSRSRRK